MPTGVRREGGARRSTDWLAVLCIGAVLAILATLFVTVARAERPQATERVLIFSCAHDDMVTCPQQLTDRYNRWTATHPSYFITGRQVSTGVAEQGVVGYPKRYLHTMSLSVFYINKYGD